MWQLNWTDTTLIDWHKLAEVLTYDPRQPMIFNSGVFLLLFLGFSFVYMLLQKRTTARLLFVTLFSYYFYYKSSGVYFFLLGTVTVTDFWLAHVMDRTQSPLKRKGLVATSLLVNLGLLCYFKYTNFFYEMLAPLWGGEFHPLDIFRWAFRSLHSSHSVIPLMSIVAISVRWTVCWTMLFMYRSFRSLWPDRLCGPVTLFPRSAVRSTSVPRCSDREFS